MANISELRKGGTVSSNKIIQGQACHTRFAVFFPLPSCCVSSLIQDTYVLGRFANALSNDPFSVQLENVREMTS